MAGYPFIKKTYFFPSQLHLLIEGNKMRERERGRARGREEWFFQTRFRRFGRCRDAVRLRRVEPDQRQRCSSGRAVGRQFGIGSGGNSKIWLGWRNPGRQVKDWKTSSRQRFSRGAKGECSHQFRVGRERLQTRRISNQRISYKSEPSRSVGEHFGGAQESISVFLDNLDWDCSVFSLCRFLSPFKGFIKATVVRKKRRWSGKAFGFATFFDEVSARVAVERLNRCRFRGSLLVANIARFKPIRFVKEGMRRTVPMEMAMTKGTGKTANGEGAVKSIEITEGDDQKLCLEKGSGMDLRYHSEADMGENCCGLPNNPRGDAIRKSREEDVDRGGLGEMPCESIRKEDLKSSGPLCSRCKKEILAADAEMSADRFCLNGKNRASLGNINGDFDLRLEQNCFYYPLDYSWGSGWWFQPDVWSSWLWTWYYWWGVDPRSQWSVNAWEGGGAAPNVWRRQSDVSDKQNSDETRSPVNPSLSRGKMGANMDEGLDVEEVKTSSEDIDYRRQNGEDVPGSNEFVVRIAGENCEPAKTDVSEELVVPRRNNLSGDISSGDGLVYVALESDEVSDPFGLGKLLENDNWKLYEKRVDFHGGELKELSVLLPEEVNDKGDYPKGLAAVQKSCVVNEVAPDSEDSESTRIADVDYSYEAELSFLRRLQDPTEDLDIPPGFDGVSKTDMSLDKEQSNFQSLKGQSFQSVAVEDDAVEEEFELLEGEMGRLFNDQDADSESAPQILDFNEVILDSATVIDGIDFVENGQVCGDLDHSKYVVKVDEKTWRYDYQKAARDQMTLMGEEAYRMSVLKKADESATFDVELAKDINLVVKNPKRLKAEFKGKFLEEQEKDLGKEKGFFSGKVFPDLKTKNTNGKASKGYLGKSSKGKKRPFQGKFLKARPLVRRSKFIC